MDPILQGVTDAALQMAEGIAILIALLILIGLGLLLGNSNEHKDPPMYGR